LGKRSDIPDGSAPSTGLTKRAIIWNGANPREGRRTYPDWPARWLYPRDPIAIRPISVDMDEVVVGTWSSDARYGIGTSGLDGCVALVVAGTWHVLLSHFSLSLCTSSFGTPLNELALPKTLAQLT